MPLTVNYTTDTEYDSDFEAYVNIALANGFSKGTANVSPADMKKLHGLLEHYRKQKHPFTACVRDNRKRFGPLTEKYCAVIKDLIVGNTHWRNQKNKKHLAEETLVDLYALDVPEGFLHALSEWDVEEAEEVEDLNDETKEVFFGLISAKNKIEAALNDEDSVGMSFWVEDIAEGKALVCSGGTDFYTVNFSVDSTGEVTLAEEEAWIPMNEADLSLSREETVAEVFLGDSKTEWKDGLVYKEIAREGVWKVSPGPGQIPVDKPLTFIREGESDPDKLIVSLAE